MVKRNLELIIHGIGKGFGHIAAAAIAIPVGICTHSESNQEGVIRIIEKEFVHDEPLKNELLAYRREYQRSQKGLRNNIVNWYNSLKPV